MDFHISLRRWKLNRRPQGALPLSTRSAFNNLKTGQKLDSSFKGEDILKEADCSRIAVQYSYRDGEIYYFMDMEDFTQYGMEASQIDGQIPYLVEQQEDIIALIVDGPGCR